MVSGGGGASDRATTESKPVALAAKSGGAANASGVPVKPTRRSLQLVEPRPPVHVHLSGPPTELTATTVRVPVAPALIMSGREAPIEMPLPNDAATVAWRLHAAPVPPVQKPGLAGKKYGRSVGGPAPPFLAVPPMVAAQIKAANLP